MKLDNINKELAELNIQLKNNIISLMEENRFNEAKDVIGKYEEVIKDDFDIQLIKYKIKARERSSSCEVIKINTDNKDTPQPGHDIYSTRDNVVSGISDNEAPIVSILVLGYNNLEKYTKTCVESIIKYTKEIDYELILIDNGSSDGTFEYFENVPHYNKKIVRITKNLGASYGTNQGLKLAVGKYVVCISNDIFVTQKWLNNMLKCALSDRRIGMVVPLTDNVSNLQSINLNFTDFDDMQCKAAEYNMSDPRKWHERLRLVTPILLVSRACLDMVGMSDYGFFHDFADDDWAFRVRRAGYKAILCKDVFVRHAGVATRDPEVSRRSIEKGRITFKNKYYGIDAWDDVNNYESAMMLYVTADKEFIGSVPNVLGVDVLCGTPVLEIKNTLRRLGVFSARLSAFSTKAQYWLDLKTVCDGKVEIDRPEYILDHFGYEKFDYIILGQPLNAYDWPNEFLEKLLQILSSEGQLLIRLKNTYDISTLLKTVGVYASIDNSNYHHISVEALSKKLTLLGYTIKDIAIEQHYIDENIQAFINNVNFTDENALIRAMVKDYIINIVKI